MKFGQMYSEYLHGEKVNSFDLDKFSHVDYKSLKKVLKTCRCQNDTVSDLPRYQSCPRCDQIFFSEIMKEASGVAGCFSSRVRHLVHLHCTGSLQRCLLHLFQCFKDDQQALVQEGRMLIGYVIMNAIALKKILKKYDKVHKSVSGMNFKSKLQAEHLEISQSPWLIELVALYLNFNESNHMIDYKLHDIPFSCDLTIADSEPVLRLVLPGYANLEYNLTCPICLNTVFHPSALSCGHIFCKSCACSAGSVLIFQGLKSASPKMKCPVCREDGVYGNAVSMAELNLLLKRRFKEQWKERIVEEHGEVTKQTKDYWELQTRYFSGI
ncbi:putative transcription factor interactor and regulator C2H2 family [Helianthus anomalus]